MLRQIRMKHLIAVIVEFIIAGECQECTKSRSKGKEHLGSCRYPYLGINNIDRYSMSRWSNWHNNLSH